jgi:hypothetical protein
MKFSFFVTMPSKIANGAMNAMAPNQKARRSIPRSRAIIRYKCLVE